MGINPNYLKTIKVYIILQTIMVYCRGTRAVKGGGLRILWRRPTRVRIPSPALILRFCVTE